MSLYHLLEQRASAHGSDPLLLSEGRVWSSSEMLAATDRWGDHLAAAGLTPQDRAVVQIPNSPEFLAVWFGLIRQGAVMVPLNPAAPEAEVQWTVRHSGARLVLRGSREASNVSSRLGEAPVWDISELSPRHPLPGAATDDAVTTDTAAVLYTSGSTGRPKGCLLTHAYYEFAGRAFAEHLKLSEADRLLLMLPLFHMNPQVTTVAGALISGATIAWVERFSLSRFWNQVEALQPTQAFLIGAIPVLLVRQQEGKRSSSLRKVVCAGLQDDLHAECEKRFGFQMVEAYGLTEAGIVTMEDLDEPHRPGSVGRPVSGRTIEIRHTDGSHCRPNEDGEIWIGGECLMTGYLNDPEATRAALSDGGWLRTSDVGHLDREGRLYFTGRRDDIVRRSGENISLREVEGVIRSHPAVSEVAVVAVPNEVYGVELRAYVVLATSGSITGDDLFEYCSARLSPHKVPRFIHLSRDLPRTGMERVSKMRLREEGPLGEYAVFERPPQSARNRQPHD